MVPCAFFCVARDFGRTKKAVGRNKKSGISETVGEATAPEHNDLRPVA